MGSCCAKCGFNDHRALQIDHINGDGKEERIKYGGRSRNKWYEAVVESLRNCENRYQLLCANCNWIKRAENCESSKFGKVYSTRATK